MCGIAGIIYKDKTEALAAEIGKMLFSIAHRGPDNEGVWLQGCVLLGHRRLSIIDTSIGGNQPMQYKDFIIVFNGEIYNYIEIRLELQRDGHIFVTDSDTEVVLHTYEVWGKDCVNHFVGMWAFAIYDSKRKIVFFSRDRFGIKPFYYYSDKKSFIFASEIKAILATGIKPKVNIDTSMTYIVVGLQNYTNSTFFEGINQLLPGQNMVLDLNNGEMCFQQYYDISKIELKVVDANAYAEILKDSIRLHLRSDVPIGTCLSGGLDSSTIAAIASGLLTKNCNKKFAAVTAQSELSLSDESHYASQVARYCDLDWHLVKPVYDDFVKNINNCLYIQDEPVGGPSVFMQYWVMKTAKEAGLKVMLDGQGGDETLLGYERYYPPFLWFLFSSGYWFLFTKEYSQITKHSKLTNKMLIEYILYFSFKSIRKKVLRNRSCFLKSDYVESALKVFGKYSSRYFDLRSLQCAEIMKYQLPNLLHYEDRNSMAHSIEARVPFLDHRCVEAAIALSPTEKIKFGYTKYALRKLASSVLPESIAWRRNKLGFEAPEEIWLEKYCSVMQKRVRGSLLLQKFCKEIPDLKNISLSMRWKLYNIAVWENQYNVKF